MQNKKDRLILYLKRYEFQERIQKNRFKEKAYAKVIQGISLIDKVETIHDIEHVEGIGESIYAKCEAFFSGISNEDKEIEAIHLFQQVHGIGPVKATELVQKYKLYTLDDLRSKSTLLQPIQRIGLKYVENSMLRIPRKEMDMHSSYLHTVLYNVTNGKLLGCIVGSYRRKKESSGDIDMLITHNSTTKNLDHLFAQFISVCTQKGYIIDMLSSGKKKCMAFCRIGDKLPARRLDLLYTPPEEFVTSLLYFTGSQEFNIKIRSRALELGYTLNEHALTPLSKEYPIPPLFTTEKELFSFLQMEYISPDKR